MSTVEKIQEYVMDRIRNRSELTMDMSPDQEIVNTVLDSFGIMELVVEIEENFKITFLDEELLLKNFTTPSQIAHLVYDKLIQKVE